MSWPYINLISVLFEYINQNVNERKARREVKIYLRKRKIVQFACKPIMLREKLILNIKYDIASDIVNTKIDK